MIDSGSGYSLEFSASRTEGFFFWLVSAQALRIVAKNAAGVMTITLPPAFWRKVPMQVAPTFVTVPGKIPA